MSRNPKATNREDIELIKMRGEFAKIQGALDEKISALIPQMEEEQRRKGTLKPGEHLTISDALRIMNEERSMRAPSTQAQGNTFGYWTPEGNLIPQDQVLDYLRRKAGLEPLPTCAAQASPATTPGTLFNQQPVMGTIVQANTLPTTEMSGAAVVVGVPFNKQ
jgi:hypothetical protein